MKKIIQNTSQKSSNSNFSHSQKHSISNKMKAPLNFFKTILLIVLLCGFLNVSAQFTVAGPRSSCNQVNIYTITNFVVGSNYSVAINPAAAGVVTAVNGNYQFQITWSASPPNASVTVTQTNPAASYSFDVYSCCRPAPGNNFYLNDMRAGLITPGNGFTVTTISGQTTVSYTAPAGQTLVINGVFTIDVPLFTFTNNQNDPILMGQGALIDFIAQGAAGPEILISNSTLRAGCGQFWKGIRLNGNAIKINNNSIIRDAEYAIENRNGIIKSDLGPIFLNNYIGIYAPPLL